MPPYFDGLPKLATSNEYLNLINKFTEHEDLLRIHCSKSYLNDIKSVLENYIENLEI